MTNKQEPLPGKTQTAVFEVQGIVCAGCATDMETVLLGKDGVLDVQVSYADGTVTIEFNPKETDQYKVFAGVKKLGFETKMKTEP